MTYYRGAQKLVNNNESDSDKLHITYIQLNI